VADAVNDGSPRGGPAAHVEWRRFRDGGALAEAAAAEFANVVREAVRDRGTAFVVLSGGGTPRATYRMLALAPLREAIAWRDTEFFWGDERAVPPEHPDSNFGMARDALLAFVAAPAQLHRMGAERPDRDRAARDYEDEIRTVLGAPPGGTPPRFDLVLLGLGADGHTASLFPGSPALQERSRWVVAAPGPRPDSPRITMTLPLLNRARRVMFLVSGPDKAAILGSIAASKDAVYPAQRIAPDGGVLLWMVDDAAAPR